MQSNTSIQSDKNIILNLIELITQFKFEKAFAHSTQLLASMAKADNHFNASLQFQIRKIRAWLFVLQTKNPTEDDIETMLQYHDEAEKYLKEKNTLDEFQHIILPLEGLMYSIDIFSDLQSSSKDYEEGIRNQLIEFEIKKTIYSFRLNLFKAQALEAKDEVELKNIAKKTFAIIPELKAIIANLLKINSKIAHYTIQDIDSEIIRAHNYYIYMLNAIMLFSTDDEAHLTQEKQFILAEIKNGEQLLKSDNESAQWNFARGQLHLNIFQKKPTRETLEKAVVDFKKASRFDINLATIANIKIQLCELLKEDVAQFSLKKCDFTIFREMKKINFVYQAYLEIVLETFKEIHLFFFKIIEQAIEADKEFILPLINELIDSIEHAIDLFKPFNSTSQLSVFNHNLQFVHSLKIKFEKQKIKSVAKKPPAKTSKEEEIKLKNEQIKAQVKDHLIKADKLFNNKEYQEALTQFEMAFSAWETLTKGDDNVRQQKMEAAQKSAACYFQTNNFPRAIENIEKAIRLAKTIPLEGSRLSMEDLINQKKIYNNKLKENNLSKVKGLPTIAELSIVKSLENLTVSVEQPISNPFSLQVQTLLAEAKKREDEEKHLLQKAAQNEAKEEANLAKEMTQAEKKAAKNKKTEKNKRLKNLSETLKKSAEEEAKIKADTKAKILALIQQSETKRPENTVKRTPKDNKLNKFAPTSNRKKKTLLGFIFKAVSKKTLQQLFDFSTQEPIHGKVSFTGSLVFKLIMLYCHDDKELASQIPVHDIDMVINAEVKANELKKTNIEKILIDENFNGLTFEEKKRGDYYTNYQAHHEEWSIDLTLKDKKYKLIPSLIPSTEQVMIFSKTASNNIHDISIEFEKNKFLIIKDKDAGKFFQNCKENIFTLNELPNPEDNKVTGYFDRLIRATKKFPFMKHDMLTSVALSFPWQLYYFSRKIANGSIEAGEKEIIQLLKRQKVDCEDVRNVLSSFIYSNLLFQENKSFFFQKAPVILKEEHETNEDVVLKEMEVGNTLLSACLTQKVQNETLVESKYAKQEIAVHADKITKILLTFMTQKLKDMSRVKTSELLRAFHFAKNYLLANYELLTPAVFLDQIQYDIANIEHAYQETYPLTNTSKLSSHSSLYGSAYHQVKSSSYIPIPEAASFSKSPK